MMASGDVLAEVEIQPEMQEVEIESVPVEIPLETVETDMDGQAMISLQALPEPGREEIILQTQEEIVGGDLSAYDQIPVPNAGDIYIQSSPGPSRRVQKKGKKNAVSAVKLRTNDIITDFGAAEPKNRKWEQKQVQIKTLEGEFSVTMWASGTDDGE